MRSSANVRVARRGYRVCELRGRSLAQPRLPHARYEPADALERFFDLLVGGGVAGADVAGAAGPEGGARHHRHLLLPQQALGEVFVGEAGAADGGEGVEGALRLEAGEAQPVEPVDDEAAAAVVLRASWPAPAPRRCAGPRGRRTGEGVGAHIMMYWCTFIIASRMSAGAQAQPTRQPVMA